MNFIKNKLYDRLITLHKGKLSSKIKFLRARHVNRRKLEINQVICAENGWYLWLHKTIPWSNTLSNKMMINACVR